MAVQTEPVTGNGDAPDPLRETARLLGTLLIARRDVKAVEVPTANPADWIWVPDKSKWTVKDFTEHLKGDKCLGTYLLDEHNQVKFLAFDVDLKRNCPYYVVESWEVIEQRLANDEYEAFRKAREKDPPSDGCLDLVDRVGNLEAALHDNTHEGYAWARIRLMGVLRQLQTTIRVVAGLECLLIVTGGGAHAIVPFGELIPASEARALGRSIMEHMAYWEQKNDNFWTPCRATPDPPAKDMTYTHYSVEIEVFPKQDEIKNEGGLGNLLRLPFGRHGATGIRSFALDTPTWEATTMKLPKLHPLDAMKRIAASLGIE